MLHVYRREVRSAACISRVSRPLVRPRVVAEMPNRFGLVRCCVAYCLLIPSFDDMCSLVDTDFFRD